MKNYIEKLFLKLELTFNISFMKKFVDDSLMCIPANQVE